MNQDLRRKLNRITDILWAGGVTNPVTYIEQISYLIYLKLCFGIWMRMVLLLYLEDRIEGVQWGGKEV